MNKTFRLNNTFGNINGRIHRLWGDAPEIATIHTKSSNITSSSNSFRGFRLSRIAAALLAALSVPAIAEDIIYDDTHTTNPGLQVEPVAVTTNPVSLSFFPTNGTSLSDNTVTINTVSSVQIPFRVYGGVTTGAEVVNGNNVFINAGAKVSDSIYGGFSQFGSAIGNNVFINAGALVSNIIYGGFSQTGNATGNTVTLAPNVTVNSAVRGGSNRGTGETSNNAVIMEGGAVSGDVYGGINSADEGVATGEVTANTVSIKGGTVTGAVNGGYSVNGNVTQNAVEITNGTMTGRVHGGFLLNSFIGRGD